MHCENIHQTNIYVPVLTLQMDYVPHVEISETRTTLQNYLETAVPMKRLRKTQSLDENVLQLSKTIAPEKVLTTEAELQLKDKQQEDNQFRRDEMENDDAVSFAIKTFPPMEETPSVWLQTYVCDICSREFEWKICLEVHKARHTTERPFLCKYCPTNYKSKRALNQHIKQKHLQEGNQLHREDEQTFVCDICNRKFKWKSHLERHKLRHTTERPFVCKYCPKNYKSKRALNQHIKQKHLQEGNQLQTEEQTFVCDICNRTFKWKSHLEKHNKARHTTERPFVCKYCPKNYKTKYGLNQHVIQKHLQEDNLPHGEISETRTTLQNYLETAVPTKRLRRTQSLEENVLQVSQPIAPEKVLTTEAEVQLKDKQQEDNQFRREEMENDDAVSFAIKTFPPMEETPSVWLQTYVCDICSGEFEWKICLELHKARHTTERPFVCKYCPKNYKSKRHLNQHVKQKHLQEGNQLQREDEQTFVCDLERHKARHARPFVCKYCPKNYESKRHLNQHVKHKHLQEDEQTFLCDICNRTIKRKSYLQTHKARHATERPFVCKFCPKNYKTKCDLSQHVKHKHGTKTKSNYFFF